MAPGETMRIPLSGWSEATVPDWGLSAQLWGGNVIGQGVDIIGSRLRILDGGAFTPTLNAGEQATLSVTMPGGAASGSWFGVVVHSYDPSRPRDSHYWPVGFYVP
jgi:hypothetical protein